MFAITIPFVFSKGLLSRSDSAKHAVDAHPTVHPLASTSNSTLLPPHAAADTSKHLECKHLTCRHLAKANKRHKHHVLCCLTFSNCICTILTLVRN